MRVGSLLTAAVVAALIAVSFAVLPASAAHSTSGKGWGKKVHGHGGGCSVDGIDDGVINFFAVADTPSAVIGENISPAAYDRMADLWLQKTNARGGIRGCQVAFDVADDEFVVDTCVGLYEDAVASGQYDFFVGPTNSGCMAQLPPITNAAGKWLFSGVAADHQPFLDPQFSEAPFVAQPSVATIVQGRSIAVVAERDGWQRTATVVPNFAFGQDIGNAFSDHYAQLVPSGQIVSQQTPEFDEDNFVPLINAMLAENPDGIAGAFLAAQMLSFMAQWLAAGDQAVPVVAGLGSLDAMQGTSGPAEIPANFYAFDRGNWRLVSQTKIGKEFVDLYLDTYGSVPDSFTMQILSTLQMAKALIKDTRSVDPSAWRTRIEKGTFGFKGPYQSGRTYVNPINHMADGCASVGQIVWDTTLGAVYDPDTFSVACLSDVLRKDEAIALTTNPAVTDKAIDTYYALTDIGDLNDAVKDLADVGVLKKAHGKRLSRRLVRAEILLRYGWTRPAKYQLRVFSWQVRGLVRRGKLSSAQGQPLIDAARAIVVTL